MENSSKLKELGFSQYEAACYMALVQHHPVNGSQLSRFSGIARSRIYDVLRSLTAKGYVVEVNTGYFAPLPSDELIRRLKRSFETNIEEFEVQINKTSQKEDFEYIWTLTGYDNVMEKACAMIQSSKKEIYARLFPEADQRLGTVLKKAEKRGVAIRYIAMGEVQSDFEIQVAHPDQDTIATTLGGRSFDIITDNSEALTGIFQQKNVDESPVNWTRNQWFVTAARDSLKHDFYHCFLYKILDLGIQLTPKEKGIYNLIKTEH
jgi:sugar-specific transcriptional regulator TrmB